MYTFSITAFVSLLALASSASSLAVGRQAGQANGQAAPAKDQGAQANGQATPATSPSPQCAQPFTILQSETCGDVASEHGLKLNDFVTLNPGINCNAPLSPGQVVCIRD